MIGCDAAVETLVLLGSVAEGVPRPDVHPAEPARVQSQQPQRATAHGIQIERKGSPSYDGKSNTSGISSQANAANPCLRLLAAMLTSMTMFTSMIREFS
jgi:hypothetical protein